MEGPVQLGPNVLSVSLSRTYNDEEFIEMHEYLSEIEGIDISNGCKGQTIRSLEPGVILNRSLLLELLYSYNKLQKKLEEVELKYMKLKELTVVGAGNV